MKDRLAKTILILGATGKLGNVLMTKLSKSKDLNVFGTVRSFEGAKRFLPFKILSRIHTDVEAENIDSVIQVIEAVKPDVIINTIRLTHQVKHGNDIALNISVNSLFPHRLARLSALQGARLIHFSTDCVFSGGKGNYQESDLADAKDIYGRTRFLGEVSMSNCLTIRTSTIGHGLEEHSSLIDWFLSCKGKTKGYTKAIYSGFPTIEIARIMAEYIIPKEKLSGIYHVSSEPISKYELLKLVARIYGKKITIEPFEDVVIDRSLDSTKFRKVTGYQAPSWEALIRKMFVNYKSNPNFIKY